MAEATRSVNKGPEKVRTAGETGPARPRARPGGRPPAPRSTASGGASARLLAPLALVVCLIAVFAVLSAGGTDSPTRGETSGEQSSATQGGEATGDDEAATTGATGPVRSTYRVKPGDSFAAIAEKTGVEVDTLAELNPDVDPRALQPGQKLKLK